MLDFISIDFSGRTLLFVLLFIHFYLIVRYCVGRILPRKDMSQSESLKNLIVVALVPIIGYFWVLRETE